MKLSIIIPVYRVETTLDRCVESVLHQNLDDFEVILVDDGSPDKCPQMCDDWAKKDAHIQVIHKSNGGLGDARNAGVNAAIGDYITFADSDDYIQPNSYQPLIQLLNSNPDYDFVEYPVVVHFGGKHQSMLTFKDQVFHNINDYWTKLHTHTHCYVWNKIFKRQLFDGIQFPIGYVFDDANAFPRVLKRCKTVATSSCGLYYYCDNPRSLSANADYRQLQLLLESHLNHGFPIDDVCYMDLVNIQMDIYELSNNPILLRNRRVNVGLLNGKQKLKGIALNLLGIKFLCITNKHFHKIWRNH